MIADGADLVGDEVEIRVVANTDGGLWLRPLRGDMLRLPETEPQVCTYKSMEKAQYCLFDCKFVNKVFNLADSFKTHNVFLT